MRTLLLIFCCFFSMAVAVTSQCSNPCTPGRVEILPVFFVPEGGTAPTGDQKDKMMEHLIWSQTRYYEMLMERSTFIISDKEPVVFFGEKSDDFYQAEEDRGAGAYADELLNYFNYTRFDCPYVFVVIYMNSDIESSFPIGGGRPMNAGFNTGGGIIILSSNALDSSPRFQSTLQHELGHSFGLPHVNAYGYDMDTNESIMSYNPTHWTNGLLPSPTPGILIPEDLRGLALNKLVFPDLYFNPNSDIPDDYTIFPNVPTIGVFPIPNQHDYAITVTANVAAAFNTEHKSLVQGRIKPTGIRAEPPSSGVTYDRTIMWHSPLIPAGESIIIDLLFPVTVTLDKISLHSQHSGYYHIVDKIEIHVLENGSYDKLLEKDVRSADEWFEFEASTSDSWRLFLKPAESNYSVIRGLQFYYLDEGVFPPIIPYDYENPYINAQPSVPELDNPMNHEEISQMNVELAWYGVRVSQFRLQVDTTIRFCNPILNSLLQSESYAFEVPEDNKKYYWRVKGLNEAPFGSGFSSWSSVNEFFVLQDNTSIGSLDYLENELVIYPNPSSGDFVISAKSIISEVNIIDMLGRNVLSAKPNQTQFNCSLERSGVYFVNLTTLNGVLTRKLIINNK